MKFEIIFPNGEVAIAQMNGKNKCMNYNAQLISSAPEMLECLEAILDAYNYGEQQPLWEEIEALVKKVKGSK